MHTSIEQALQRFWELENIGITDTPDKNESSDKVKILSSNPELLKKYSEIIEEQERKGFIEKVPEDTTTSSVVHYIPHHYVKKDSSTTPIRIIYYCSCRESRDKPSLNDCLDSTQLILNDLTSVLTRFRLHEFAITTDIEKAFLHFGLHENDRDATRFLWLKDPNDLNSSLVPYRFKAVLFGATCSPFILNATILKHLQNKNSTSAGILRRDLCVDNVISSFASETDAIEYFRESRKIMMDAGMKLRSWASNSKLLHTEAMHNGLHDSDDLKKLLGLRWDPMNDKLSFAKREIPKIETVTKRLILQYSSQIYDPLGILSPVTVRAKILLQSLWKQRYEWDNPVPDEICKTWNSLANDLNIALSVQFPRKYFNKVDGETTLHIFADASTKSYGAAAYICNRSESKLVMAKNTVAPLKSLTFPQLELMAALNVARLGNHLQNSLPKMNIVYWSDSQIVLHWLSSKRLLKKFVSSRIFEIRELRSAFTWKYCPTHDNPADLLTRGLDATSFMNSALWKHGPSWIYNREA
ncbi:uncharacterized protein LOC133181151 [Saccostrea echinata]|uniref:uncharacterized protein LOC133181151 n=1 Tax=Saccostrea echinata TaxID=191078 RepID=UPI002A7F9195|nr:uncharacterized protein LOC133181151 [Saccostrea echinata]